MRRPQILRRVRVFIYLHPFVTFIAALWITLFAYGSYDGWSAVREDKKIVEQSLEFIRVGLHKGEWTLYTSCKNKS